MGRPPVTPHGWGAEARGPRDQKRFVAWAASIGGAALVLGRIGTLVTGLAWLRHPTETWQALVGTVAWVALSIAFRFSQKAVDSNDSS